MPRQNRGRQNLSISKPAHLAWLSPADQCGPERLTIRFEADISLKGLAAGWRPIRRTQTSSLDEGRVAAPRSPCSGQGRHTVSGLFINVRSSQKCAQGLFGTVGAGSSFTDLHVEGCVIRQQTSSITFMPAAWQAAPATPALPVAPLTGPLRRAARAPSRAALPAICLDTKGPGHAV